MTQFVRVWPRRTPARQRWLERLEQSPTIRRAHSKTAFHCMRLGWTEYRKREPADIWPKEQLTAKGRRVLAEWRAEDAVKAAELALVE